MEKAAGLICRLSNVFTLILNGCSHLFVLAIRFYLFRIFFWSGWLKLTSWSSTLYLFSHEYKIVGMSSVTAAYIGTGAELVLPALLVLGLGARLPAVALFVFNVFNVIFYPVLMKPTFACALKDHILWACLIAVVAFYGHGKISIDYLLQKKLCKNYQY